MTKRRAAADCAGGGRVDHCAVHSRCSVPGALLAAGIAGRGSSGGSDLAFHQQLPHTHTHGKLRRVGTAGKHAVCVCGCYSAAAVNSKLPRLCRDFLKLKVISDELCVLQPDITAYLHGWQCFQPASQLLLTLPEHRGFVATATKYNIQSCLTK